MLTQLIDGKDIIALSVGGRIEKDEMELAFRLLDEAFARDGKVHIFVEVLGLESIAPDALLFDLRHVFHYLVRLKQFGRIAIVTDQSWVRIASRIESALLPYVSYEVYPVAQRDRALAWVKGEVDTPHPQAVRRIPGDDDIQAFEVDGRITADELDGLYAHLFEVAQSDSPLKILVRMKRYDGFEPAILVDPKTVERKFSLLHRVSRYAIVGGPDWLTTLVKLFDPLFKIELRHFPLDSEDAARAWLSEDGDEGQ
ncbi:SpoIIAA family protein [Rhizorhapis sp. SPR117]|uniref:STAS/SEC14 domain-containing protein n=1 Tax=Rhizorhapis sp. SPR117 TaxID=2912611 RepID=UPI001F235070|nr:STAS/SEC14 domain-containing protein [Rhizorhapis sp. SPR117]